MSKQPLATLAFGALLVALIIPPALAQHPAWAADVVWYQIFPERFCNGDASNDPTAEDIGLLPGREWHISPWTSDWYTLQPWESAFSSEFYQSVFNRRYGGDLQGVLDRLDYLRSLGVTALYFNPLFESVSLHKYDAASYHHIDRTFGPDPTGDRRLMRQETDEPASWHWTSADSLFLVLVREAHARKMKVVIDGVFNHCGTAFFAFQDVVQNQRRSRYADWFDVRVWDDDRTPPNEFVYKGWWDHLSMPEFQEDERGFVKPVREYFFHVTRRWMDPDGDGDPSDGVDGWRLDVANDVSPVFWREWRRLVKSINPDAYIVGEIWDNAAEWLKGDQFDAVMNYRFARACVRFFIDTNEDRYSVAEFDRELRAIRADYPDTTNDVLQNLLESHDTDRLPSQIMNPNRRFDADNGLRQNPQYDVSAPTEQARRIQKPMVLFQMTYVGAPMVYYGSEAGMWGADDPDDRKPMVWEEMTYKDEASTPSASRRRAADPVRFDRDMFAWYQKVIGLRNSSAALRRGCMVTRATDDAHGLYVFERHAPGDTVRIVINNSAQEQEYAAEGSFVELLSGERAEGGIRVAAKSGIVLRREGRR